MSGQWRAALNRTVGRRRFAAAAGALAALGGSRAPAAKKRKKKPKLAATCAAPANTTLGGSWRYAQTFTPTKTGKLHEIRVVVRKQTDLSPGNWVVQVVPVFGGVPAHEAKWVFAATMIPDADVPPGVSTLAAKFAGPTLSGGSTYAFVVARLSDSVRVEANLNGPCAGNAFYNGDGSPFIKFDAYDLVYSVFVV